MVDTASPCCLSQSLPGARGLSPGCSQASGSTARQGTWDGPRCAPGSYGYRVRRLQLGPSVRRWLWLLYSAALRRVGEGLMLCCLSSPRVSVRVTRILPPTARLCKGGLGPAARGPPWTARTDGGRRTGSLRISTAQTHGRRRLASPAQPVLSIVLDKVFIVFKKYKQL